MKFNHNPTVTMKSSWSPVTLQTITRAYNKTRSKTKTSNTDQLAARQAISSAMELVAAHLHTTKAKVVQAFQTSRLDLLCSKSKRTASTNEHDVLTIIDHYILNAIRPLPHSLERSRAKIDFDAMDFHRWMAHPLKARKAVAMAVVKKLVNTTYEITLAATQGSVEQTILAKRANSDPYVNGRLVNELTMGYKAPKDFGWSDFSVNQVLKAHEAHEALTT